MSRWGRGSAVKGFTFNPHVPLHGRFQMMQDSQGKSKLRRHPGKGKERNLSEAALGTRDALCCLVPLGTAGSVWVCATGSFCSWQSQCPQQPVLGGRRGMLGALGVRHEHEAPVTRAVLPHYFWEARPWRAAGLLGKSPQLPAHGWGALPLTGGPTESRTP